MSTPGWYPDPGGRSGHYRFWDGETWAPTTTANPAPTVGGGGPPSPRRPSRHVGRWLVVGAVLLVVLAVVGALVLRPGAQPVADPVPTASATGPVGGEDPTSPVPTDPFPSSVVPTQPSPRMPSPSVAQPGSADPVSCPVGNPFSRQDHARDGRVHGGSLSFPRQPGWEDPGPEASAFTWAYDLGETDIQLTQSRYASYAVGAVSVADGFEDPHTAARLAMRCTIASALYSDVSSRTDLVDEETTVDGYRAWSLRSEIRTYDARTSFQGDTVQITVVDLDSPESLAFFWGSAPIGDETFDERLDEVVQQLHVG
ncbi:MAG: DUF2510 domain-containing protein [Janthinobacterium lividum]